MSFIIPLILFLAFAGWVLFRLLIRKDLRQHMDVLYAAGFFFGVWALLYWMLFS